MKFANDPTTGPELKGASAQVSNVQVNPDGTADVTYTFSLNGTPALMNQIGKAIQVNGQWRVAGTTFCDLAALGATNHRPGSASDRSGRRQQLFDEVADLVDGPA